MPPRPSDAAFVRYMGLLQEALAGQPANAIRGMEWERRYRSEPGFRADYFVRTWQQLGDRHELMNDAAMKEQLDGVPPK